MTMAEKMARALFAEWLRLHPSLDATLTQQAPAWGWEETNKAAWFSMAAVALEAMREPAPEMLRAFLPRTRVGDVQISYDDELIKHFLANVAKDWSATIDAAILEAKTEEIQ